MTYIEIHDNFLTVNSYNTDVTEIIDGLKSYILKNECERLCVDVSALTLIDAAKTCVLCSSYHFAKYPLGIMRWIVKDEEIRIIIKPLMLKNTEVLTKKAIIPNLDETKKELLYCLR